MASPFPFTAGQVLTAAQLNGIGDWTSFTPSWTNLTIGNATQSFAYSVVNDIVFIEGRLVVTDGTTSISGLPSFTAPVTGVAATGPTPLGQVTWFDSSAAEVYYGFPSHAGSNELWLWVTGASGTYVNRLSPSASVPFALGTSDQIGLSIAYRSS